MEDRIYTIGEIKEMCMQSYMRGMSIQYDNDMKIKRKNTTPPFSKWVDELIKTCPINRFK